MLRPDQKEGVHLKRGDVLWGSSKNGGETRAAGKKEDDKAALPFDREKEKVKEKRKNPQKEETGRRGYSFPVGSPTKRTRQGKKH